MEKTPVGGRRGRNRGNDERGEWGQAEAVRSVRHARLPRGGGARARKRLEAAFTRSSRWTPRLSWRSRRPPADPRSFASRQEFDERPGTGSGAPTAFFSIATAFRGWGPVWSARFVAASYLRAHLGTHVRLYHRFQGPGTWPIAGSADAAIRRLSPGVHGRSWRRANKARGVPASLPR